MAEKCRYEESNNLGYFLSAAAIMAGIWGTIMLGPIDFTRTIYNQIIGDGPVLKRQLVEYCREGIILKQRVLKLEREDLEGKTYSYVNPESTLRDKLHLNVEEGESDKPINPQDASIEDLWDLAEEYSDNKMDRWFFTRLRNED